MQRWPRLRDWTRRGVNRKFLPLRFLFSTLSMMSTVELFRRIGFVPRAKSKPERVALKALRGYLKDAAKLKTDALRIRGWHWRRRA